MQNEYTETRIVQNPEDILHEIIECTLTSNELCVSFAPRGMQFNYTYLFDIKKKILEKYKRGEHMGIRYISGIDSTNLEVTKKFLDVGTQIKHVKNLPPMSFAITDKLIITTIIPVNLCDILATSPIQEMEEELSSVLISTDYAYRKHFKSIFEELWKKGIDTIDRIKDIEQGRETDDELADAKKYAREVLEEITNMKRNVTK
jgi:two-component system, OmpR family, sensor histidine kinase VicK